MTKEVAIKKKESFWERNKKSNGLLLKKRAKSIAISMIRAILLFWNVLYDSSADSK